MQPKIESAILFTPGRASYRSQDSPEGPIQLHLTEASAHRAYVATQVFDEQRHLRAIFAGGTPAVAEGWAPHQMPSDDEREANYMAQPLQDALRQKGWSQERIDQTVFKQPDSDSTIGDVRIAVERELLDPDEFDADPTLGIDVVSGYLHGIRVAKALSTALEVDPKRIRRVRPFTDVYGRPRTQFHKGESAPVAITKELAGIALNHIALRNVEPGNLAKLYDAEQRLNGWVSSMQPR